MTGSNRAIRAVSVYQSQGTRPAQEDHVLVQEDKGIFVIADGFGGPVPGAEASKAACEAVRSFLFKEAGDLDATLPFELRSYFSLAGNVLFNSLIYANRKVQALNRNRSVHEKGGSSVLAGFLDGSLLALANVGACGAWLFRDGRAAELVLPRTYGRLVDPFGRGGGHAEDRVPLMALGMGNDLEPEIYECRIEPGDWLLLETRSLEPALRDRLAGLQAEAWAPSVAAEKVGELFKDGQAKDNLSFTLVIF